MSEIWCWTLIRSGVLVFVECSKPIPVGRPVLPSVMVARDGINLALVRVRRRVLRGKIAIESAGLIVE